MSPLPSFRCRLFPALAALISLPGILGAQGPLPRSTPEAQGVSSDELLAFVEAADTEIDSMHSFLLARHGQVIAEGWWAPYAAERPHMLYSLSKSFTSTAVGMAVAEMKLRIDDPVLEFFPDDAPEETSRNLESMRVRDLLTMSTGHQEQPEWNSEVTSPATFLAHPVPHRPGTHFLYNTPTTFLLSAIVQNQTGQKLSEYLLPRLFQPLGIARPVWDETFQGVSQGGTGLHLRTEDIAKLGQLYLQKGEWQGRRLLPEEWVDLATSRQVSNGSDPDSDWNQGYGFQFWRCRHGAYRGDGAFGQYCIVVPDQDAVIAITSGVRNMQAVLDLLWKRLLPTFRATPLPIDREGVERLRTRLGTLRVRTVPGEPTSERWDDVRGRTYRFGENDLNLETLRLEAGKDCLDLIWQWEGNESRIPCGHGDWREGRGNIGALTDTPLAGHAAWPEPDVCAFKVCAVETPYEFTFRLSFEADRLTLEGGANIAFGSAAWPKLEGRRD